MIKGSHRAAGFMDVPFASMKYVLTPENLDPQSPQYEPYGIVVTKPYAYEAGCRPVLYLSNREVIALGIPNSELWRVVRFEESKSGWISWLHEREWRCKGDLALPKEVHAVFVRNGAQARRLTKQLADERTKF